MEFLSGGELFYHIHHPKYGAKFSEEKARFYAA
jgi:hypothetical protein